MLSIKNQVGIYLKISDKTICFVINNEYSNILILEWKVLG